MVNSKFLSEQLTSKPLSQPYTKTIVIGLGNPILSDDGIGWRVAQELQFHLQQTGNRDARGFSKTEIDFDYLSVGGLSLMESLIGYERALIIDAITTGLHSPGEVHCFPLEDLNASNPGHLTSAHDTSLSAAIEVGRNLGVHLPQIIMIVAIELKSVYDFSDKLSPTAAEAVPRAVRLALEILQSY